MLGLSTRILLLFDWLQKDEDLPRVKGRGGIESECNELIG